MLRLRRRCRSAQICAPSRSALQSGRLPVHVNSLNVGPASVNPKDPVSGFQGMPRNMTGLGAAMRRAGGYATHFVGKWDLGMATPEHTPLGRGYDDALFYFHHAAGYYSSGVELEATGEVRGARGRRQARAREKKKTCAGMRTKKKC